LTELPLQGLDLLAPFFILEIERKDTHPLIGRESDCMKFVLKQLGVRGFS